MAALPAFGEAANSLEQSLQRVATTGTSTTSLAIGTGSKTLTTQAGKAWVVGAFVYIASSASVANLMFGQITDYNSTTGSLTVNVLSYTGSGTLAAWSIGLSVPRGGTETFSGTLYANSFVMNAAASVYWNYDAPGGKVIFNFDANDFLSYDRAADAFAFFIGGTNRFYVDKFGPGRNDDASTANGLVRKSQMETAIDGAGFGRLIRVLVFTNSGTYTPAAGMKQCLVRMAGGGGSGGGGSVGSNTGLGGGGGGAGATAVALFTAAEIGAAREVTIGAGGASSTGGPGNSGGTTSFGSLLSCTGGAGGGHTVSGSVIQTALGGDGGSPSGSFLFASSGGAGGGAWAGYNSGSFLTGFGGTGGGNEFGGGGRAGNSAAVGQGLAGGGYGCGGGGAGVIAGTAASGAGRRGIVIVYEYA
ncbi:hypothetical protein [uncultured Aquabacterium sp.]|uniref:glycine-rich domain-containing protein n=1 Tax=uncultured Aquabacterium sp. TaxID=158753 RepID=UPI0025E4DB21|nr:hypothetical protein [uncultured Aquabacterium sp.]